MWDSSTQKNHSGISPAAGFSLLEVLTVVFIVGLAAAIVLPNFPQLYDRLVYASTRDTLIREINMLPYSAFDQNQDFLLTEESTRSRDPGPEGYGNGSFFDRSILDLEGARLPSNIRPAPLSIPDGWEVRIPQPIFYRASGFCTGGTVTVSVETLQYNYELNPPYCQIEP